MRRQDSFLEYNRARSASARRTTGMHIRAAVLILIAAAVSAVAQSNPQYVPLAAGAKAMYYRPDGNPSPQVAVLTVHRTSNKFGSQECTELSKRGFGVLCLNTRFENNEA